MGLQAPISIIESSLNIYKHPWHLNLIWQGGGDFQLLIYLNEHNSTNDRYFLLGQIYSTQKVHYGVLVVVQSYPWFKFTFLLFQTHYHTIL